MKRILMLAFLLLCVLPLAVVAQEVTEVPLEGQPPLDDTLVEGEPTLESVTADPASYYGQEVALEGIVAELVNVRSFVLGEGAAIDDDQVLVLNNSGQEFNIGLTRDARVRVTGTIYPAFDQGGWDQVLALPMGGTSSSSQMDDSADQDMTTDTMGDEMATEEAMMEGDMEATEEAVEEMMMEPTVVPMEGDTGMTGMATGGVTLSEYPAVVIQDRFPSHTLLVIDSVESIAFVEVTEEGAQ